MDNDDNLRACLSDSTEEGHGEGALSSADSSSPSKAPSAAPRPKKVNMFRKRQREELDFLRAKVSELEAQVEDLESRQVVDMSKASRWQILAMKMRAEKDHALSTNDLFRAAFNEQIEFGNALYAVLAKRPCLPTTINPSFDQVMAWHSLHLTQHNRAKTATDILAYQYQQLDSVLVTGQLVDCSQPFTRTVPKSWQNDSNVVEASACRHVCNADIRVVADTTWAIVTGTIPDLSRPVKVLEIFDENFVYVTSRSPWMMDMDCEYREQESLDDGHGLRIPRAGVPG
ncbi:hypothetical protein AeNC1_016251 [Aphanomyces euteiches]|nr:hypothetical protein AeNC1_016251 [Aphanomyces euteiches]